jgi:type II secretory pathway component PulF
MPSFPFRAIDARGGGQRGELEAPTPAIASQMLEARGLIVLDVGAARASGSSVVRVARPARGAIVDVTRALAGLLSAGLPLARALAAAESTSVGPVAARLASVRERVSRGDTLATALAAHPDLFSPLYVGLVRAGERAGDLAGTFERLADQLERDAELRAKLVSAAIYPALLAVVGLSAVLLLLLFVLPRFAGVLAGAGAALPRSTTLLLSAATLAQRYWFLLLLPVIAVAAGAAWVGTTAGGARAWSATLLATPVVRAMRRELIAARFARMMSVLLAGGAPALSALDDTAMSLADPLARDAVLDARARVREGGALHRAIAGTAFFPPLLAQLIALGEETGRLEDFLRKAADLFEQRTSRATTRLVALAEPLMIIALGVVVGSVALSLLQAIYGINAGSFR